MSIDWITVSAQIVNFLILVWLLKRFLYQPVIKTMDEREQRISKRLAEAERREDEAKKEIARFQRQTAELELSRNEILEQAQDEAERQKRQWLEQARGDIEQTRGNWQRQLQQDEQEFLGDLRRRSAGTIQSVAKKVLRDLADSGLEERIIDRFIGLLAELDPQARKKLADAPEALQINSAFALDAAAREKITQAVHQYLTKEIAIEFSQSPELLCGIRISGAGQRLDWNLAEYLAELSARVENAFESVKPAKSGT
ncbi:MAG: F0F1 ATP synthase subunit delta [Gammaproteobacteria bacterium]|nr:F0F1 ATP synthase subunit delta [Gammaproteobacteria bacterium]